MKNILLPLALFTFILAACTAESGQPPAATVTPVPTVPSTPVPGKIYVEPETSLGEISPWVYGSNYGPWIAVPFEMLDYAFDSGVTVLRFPGGEWGDFNDIKPYHIDSFMKFLANMGAEASISVRLPGSTPEQAADLVRYVNVEKGYGVRFWSIGNEPTLYAPRLGDEYDTEWYNREWRSFAEAMKAVDPEIILIGPEVHQFTANPLHNPKDPQGRDWMTEFLRANGDLVDVISFHRYPFPRSQTGPAATIEDLRANTREWDETVIYLRALIRQETGRDLPIAVTEANSHYNKAIGGEATPDSFYNAIWWADVLGRLSQQGVFMVNHWLLTTPSGQGGWGLINRGELSPSYFVYQMYRKFGDELVYASSDDPDLRVYAAKRADGTLTLIVLNLADEAIRKPVEIAAKPAPEARYWLFDRGHAAEDMGTIPLTGEEIEFPAQSFSLFVIP